jgi:hypothetical protein
MQAWLEQGPAMMWSGAITVERSQTLVNSRSKWEEVSAVESTQVGYTRRIEPSHSSSAIGKNRRFVHHSTATGSTKGCTKRCGVKSHEVGCRRSDEWIMELSVGLIRWESWVLKRDCRVRVQEGTGASSCDDWAHAMQCLWKHITQDAVSVTSDAGLARAGTSNDVKCSDHRHRWIRDGSERKCQRWKHTGWLYSQDRTLIAIAKQPPMLYCLYMPHQHPYPCASLRWEAMWMRIILMTLNVLYGLSQNICKNR